MQPIAPEPTVLATTAQLGMLTVRARHVAQTAAAPDAAAASRRRLKIG
jgi:hypothetical protein